MKSLLDWCVRDMEAIARVSSRDTGKTREFPLVFAEVSIRGPAGARSNMLCFLLASIYLQEAYIEQH